MNSARKTDQAEADPNPANDEASVSLNAGTSADVAVAKAISDPTPAVGAQVTFTVTVTNRGPSPATGVVVSDVLPAALNFASATPSQGSYDPGSGAWTVGDLAATQSATLTLTALVTQPGPFTNTASKAGGNEADPNPANDSASATGTAASRHGPLAREDRRTDLGVPRPAGDLHHHGSQRGAERGRRRIGHRHLPARHDWRHVDLRGGLRGELRRDQRRRCGRHHRGHATGKHGDVHGNRRGVT